jgi:AcrR family transcriptional regulator
MPEPDTADPLHPGLRLRAERERHGYTLRALAREIGVSPATLSHLETGKTRIDPTRLERIAAALAVPAHVLQVDQAPPAAQAPDWRTYPPLTFDPVLRAALEVFLEVGYHGASVRDIAARSGLSVAGIYHYHPGKQHMLRQIFDLTMAELLERGTAARAEGHDPVERFRLLVEHLALFHTRRRELGFIGATEMRSLEPANRAAVAAMRVRQQRMVDEEVTAAAAAGLFHCRSPERAARAVVTLCTSLVHWYRPDGELDAAEIAAEYVEHALDLVRFSPITATGP